MSNLACTGVQKTKVSRTLCPQDLTLTLSQILSQFLYQKFDSKTYAQREQKIRAFFALYGHFFDSKTVADQAQISPNLRPKIWLKTFVSNSWGEVYRRSQKRATFALFCSLYTSQLSRASHRASLGSNFSNQLRQIFEIFRPVHRNFCRHTLGKSRAKCFGLNQAQIFAKKVSFGSNLGHD